LNGEIGGFAVRPFHKIRTCVFPESYAYNANEPVHYLFAPDAVGKNDFTRFNRIW
jgi:hypothetical protein